MVRDYTIRPARPEDAEAIALVHATSWRDTYCGTLVSDDVLDARDFLASRERFWAAALTDERWAAIRVALAERDGNIFGIAMSNPVEGEARSWHLNVLYVATGEHGSGAGTALLNAVIDPDAPAAMRVGDPVPRAQAFHRKSGFVPNGTVTVEDNIRHIRMTRNVP